MKNFWTKVKLFEAKAEAKINAVSMYVYTCMGQMFNKLKWKWARKIESKFALYALECGRTWAFCIERAIALHEALGNDMTIQKIRLALIKVQLLDLRERGRAAFGWK